MNASIEAGTEDDAEPEPEPSADTGVGAGCRMMLLVPDAEIRYPAELETREGPTGNNEIPAMPGIEGSRM